MTSKVIVIASSLSLLYFSCSFDKNENDANKDSKQIKTIKIQLLPSFNNPSYIFIDKVAKTIRFKIEPERRVAKTLPNDYTNSLDSFERNTLIDSFYSTSFCDSIKFKLENIGMTDGLSIETIINRQTKSDTIESGNVYPQILSTNIISQINYIYKDTKDTLLKKYIKNLKTYF